jgi:glycosyltransferase involved in cell wall biosynthesis
MRTNSELTVVFLGRLERRKGALDLLQAVPEVLREVPETRFIFIGTDRAHCPGGRTHSQYINEEFASEVLSRIHLVGKLPDTDVTRWLQSADVFVAPSLYESFGLIFLEAMRWGTPVIGTTAGGIPEVVEDGTTGVLVPPGCPNKLAGALIELLKDEGRRRQLGEAGRRRIETHFSAQRMAQQVVAVYSETIARWNRSRKRFAS